MLVGGLALVALVGGGAGLLALEVMIAGNGPRVDEFDPHLADGLVPGAGGAGAGERAPVRITWMGDSTAAGVGASSADGGIARQVARRLDRPVEVTVLAVSGARIEGVLTGQVPKLAAPTSDTRPDLIVISAGANDVTHLTSIDEFRATYRSVLDRLPKDVPVVLLGVPDLGSATRLAQPLRAIAGWRGGQYDAVVREVAAASGAAYVNIAGNTGPAFRSDPDRNFARDHYHPNDAGYGVWTDAIAPVVAWRLFRAEHPDQPAPPVPKESE